MSRINAINTDEANGKAKELLNTVQAKLGITPNMTRTMAQSPSVLEAYLVFNGALGSTLNAKLREQIALLSAEENGCGYCLSAHTAIGKMAGLSDEDVLNAREGNSKDEKADAALKFAGSVLEKRGKVSDEDLASIRRAGFSDGEMGEIVAHIALNTFTNFFNEVAKTDIDFPLVEARSKNASASR